MKKLFLALIILLLLAAGGVYLFIPRQVRVSKAVPYQTNLNAAARLLLENKTWENWWPSAWVKKQEVDYKVTSRGLNYFSIVIQSGNDSINTLLRLIPLSSKDSCLFSWEAELPAAANPFQRISRYRSGVKLKKAFDVLLDSMGRFMEKTENVYGFAIKNDLVPDSVLIATRKIFTHYPDASETGQLIDQVKAYMDANGAKVLNHPMLHIQPAGPADFSVMVALPSDKVLPNTARFETKRLLKNGNLLTAPVKGGPVLINRALQQMEIYKTDYGRASPAIPYQLMITDRRLEKDTARWETLVCYPVL